MTGTRDSGVFEDEGSFLATDEISVGSESQSHKVGFEKQKKKKLSQDKKNVERERRTSGLFCGKSQEKKKEKKENAFTVQTVGGKKKKKCFLSGYTACRL